MIDKSVPALLLEDYNAIKTKIAQEYAMLYVDGNSSVESYKLACKKLSKTPSKTPRNSAHQIQTNTNVLTFITKAKEILAVKALENMKFSHANRLETTQKVIDIGLEMMALGKKTNGSDILRAVEVQNTMLSDSVRLEGMNDEEKRKQAVLTAKRILEQYDNG